MTDTTDKGLLPTGLSDALAPDAAFEASVLERLLADFSAHGFDRVNPPLIEFEDSLLDGIGVGAAEQTFRLMDPVSQKMMGVRADMTPQIARIAARRLSASPRPLRLSYAGQVLRVRGSQLRPERQFTQVGAELIGPDAATADAEVIVMAASALANLGITDLSVDLGLPTLVAAVCSSGEDCDGPPENWPRLRQALDRKDAAAVTELGLEICEETTRTLAAMLAAAGPADETLAALDSLGLSGEAADGHLLLAEVVERVLSAMPGLAITIDPVENRGFEYHTGVTFTFFAKGVRGELGSGGRYSAGDGEAATGFTLFMDTVLRAVAPPADKRRVYLPAGTAVEAAAALRAEGWITVAELSDTGDAQAQAEHQGCTHIFEDGEAREITKPKTT
ncbi:MAG: ATP phosphoribosyltransferase regulatory subunit [Alphaproteobacteria bacterium]|jgi:ATP phosphoribosyltransferase regulatory subunit|nr:ATP phosphoribosyltransferase regulatory subunit [Alphaproteobacteria bacterium]